MKKAQPIVLFLSLALILSACSSGAPPVIETPIVTPANTFVPTPAATPRWVIYEKALVNAVLPGSLYGRCEWEIWGAAGREVYVWALCRDGLRAGSVPAVIYLKENGEIERVVIPSDGAGYPVDVRALFPLDIQNRIFANEFSSRADAADEHISTRSADHSPPLIVLSGTPLP